ncbi:MAG: phosphoribosylformylglycinamidine cyclo-ligase [Candidatus Lernaella stagnicola]|nr:phosphoribosylformylglycinamidine cyclo-ligase [Candidatus Lernaella stagnicola]
MKKTRTYRDAGVDIDAGNEFVKRIKPLVQSTFRPGVHTEIGGFGAAFSLASEHYRSGDALLVTSTDGVGTKLKIAFMTGVHHTVGIDLVAMCVNDIVVMGAQPLFFLDYFATGKLSVDTAVKVVEGIVAGCKEAECSLVGGETAEMPDMYPAGEYDLAGFTVGVVDNERVIDGSTITVGDKIIGVGSSGLHSNGFSLVRKVLFQEGGFSVDDAIEELGGRPLGEELLTPTKIYVKPIQSVIRDVQVKGIAHITGGGLVDNLPRILPDRCQARVFVNSWEPQPIFAFLQNQAGIEQREMFRTFNCGVGLTLICRESETDTVLDRLTGMGEKAWILGEVASRGDDDPAIEFV